MPDNLPLPLLFTFRRCPYAIRARLAIALSGALVQQQEVELKHKPEAMLKISPKGTVPVLELTDGTVLEESLLIMQWALRQNDPMQMLDVYQKIPEVSQALIRTNDDEFKMLLDRYKYPERFPEISAQQNREHAEAYLANLNKMLMQNDYLLSQQPSFADVALVPFIRQFAQVDKVWFDASPYTALQKWLHRWVTSELFIGVIKKPD